MSILKALNSKTMELRKSRDELAGSFQAVQGFATATSKERGLKTGNFEVTDEDALRAVQKSVKQVRDTLGQLEEGNGQSTPLYARSKRELAELETLLPKMADDGEVTRVVQAFIGTLDPATVSMKSMGGVMAHLQETFGTNLDKGRASAIVKNALQA